MERDWKTEIERAMVQAAMGRWEEAHITASFMPDLYKDMPEETAKLVQALQAYVLMRKRTEDS
jgi:hypothetical protein